MNIRLWHFQICLITSFPPQCFSKYCVIIALKMNINSSLRGLDTIQNHIPPVLQRLISNNANLLFSPPNISWLFFCTCSSLSSSPFVWWEPPLPSRLSPNITFSGKLCMSQFHCSILRWPFPLIFISNVWNCNLREGIKSVYAQYLSGLLAGPTTGGHLSSPDCLLPWVPLFWPPPAISLFFPFPWPVLTRSSSTADAGCPV